MNFFFLGFSSFFLKILMNSNFCLLIITLQVIVLILFDVQIVSDLASGSPCKMLPMSLPHFSYLFKVLGFFFNQIRLPLLLFFFRVFIAFLLASFSILGSVCIVPAWRHLIFLLGSH